MNFKKIFPRSLYKRFILIIAIPIIIIQLVSIYVFYYTHLDVISKYMARTSAEQIDFIVKNFDNKDYLEVLQNFDRFSSVNILKSDLVESKLLDRIGGQEMLDPFFQFKSELRSRNINIYNFTIDNESKSISFLTTTENKIIKLQLPIKSMVPARANIFIFWLIFTSSIALIISIIFLKNQIKSLHNLKDIAEKFGRGQDVDDIKPGGSEEIRSLALSFIGMKNRIVRQMSQRTDMLSAVSHDLRTPLTRMKLQLELMPKTEDVEELKKDISDMEDLIDEYLEFTRSDEKERPKKINIVDFLKNDIEKYYNKTGNKIKSKITIDDKLKIYIKKIALKRSLINLLDNAFKYGDGVVEFSANKSYSNLIINIDDDGPGINVSERKNVLKPFYRVDNARNLDKDLSDNYKSKGSGLGLAIVNDTISSHGGRIKLSKSHLGGLKVTLYIPL